MGYSGMSYRIDFKRLRALRGSRDQVLVDRLVALAAEEPDDEGDWDDEVEASQAAHVAENSWIRAVASILNGEPMPADADKDYQFGVDLMCTLCGPQVAVWAFKGGADHLEAVEWIAEAAFRGQGLVCFTAKR